MATLFMLANGEWKQNGVMFILVTYVNFMQFKCKQTNILSDFFLWILDIPSSFGQISSNLDNETTLTLLGCLTYGK